MSNLKALISTPKGGCDDCMFVANRRYELFSGGEANCRTYQCLRPSRTFKAVPLNEVPDDAEVISIIVDPLASKV